MKNLMEDTLNKVSQKVFMPTSNKIEVTKGLCITCDNNAHCKWRQNNKIYCQHFE